MVERKVERYIKDGIQRRGALLFTVIDPLDYQKPEHAIENAKMANECGTDLVLLGGSTGVHGEFLDSIARQIKENITIPLVLFPGNIGTITRYADAIYFMSLLNSRNPYWITGAQMLGAAVVKAYNVEPLAVGYIVVSPGGTVGFVGDAKLIPREKPNIAAAYALAAEYMGFRFVITDVGSNPKEGHVPLEIVKAVRSTITIPYIVAGGIRTPQEAAAVVKAGADAVQIGTAFEKDADERKFKEFISEIRKAGKERV